MFCVYNCFGRAVKKKVSNKLISKAMKLTNISIFFNMFLLQPQSVFGQEQGRTKVEGQLVSVVAS